VNVGRTQRVSARHSSDGLLMITALQNSANDQRTKPEREAHLTDDSLPDSMPLLCDKHRVHIPDVIMLSNNL